MAIRSATPDAKRRLKTLVTVPGSRTNLSQCVQAVWITDSAKEEIHEHRASEKRVP
jgi:hypothetical protein